MIGYDLHEGQDYKNLIDAIKALGNWWHCLDSTWLVVSDRTDVAIRDYLRKHILSDDKLLVLTYQQGKSAWVGFDKQCTDWLIANM